MSRWEALSLTAAAVVTILAFADVLWQRHQERVRAAERAGIQDTIRTIVRESVMALRDEVATELKATRADVRGVADRIVRLEADQFGSNHGGMREQVNTIDAKVDRVAEQLAELRGRVGGA